MFLTQKFEHFLKRFMSLVCTYYNIIKGIVFTIIPARSSALSFFKEKIPNINELKKCLPNFMERALRFVAFCQNYTSSGEGHNNNLMNCLLNNSIPKNQRAFLCDPQFRSFSSKFTYFTRGGQINVASQDKSVNIHVILQK